MKEHIDFAGPEPFQWTALIPWVLVTLYACFTFSLMLGGLEPSAWVGAVLLLAPVAIIFSLEFV